MSDNNSLGREHTNHTEEDAYWDRDLRPDSSAGQNDGAAGIHPAKADDARTAYDIKGLHRQLDELTDDELKEIPILPAGARLEQNATYVDLRANHCKELTALGNMEAGPENWYVPKKEVDYQLWNRLIGVTNPERTGEADE